MIGPWEALVSTTNSTDPLDNEVVWHGLIVDFNNLPMNYGHNMSVSHCARIVLKGSPFAGCRRLWRHRRHWRQASTRTAPSPRH